jgi:hypothetical protein
MDIETIEEIELKPGQRVMAVMDKTGDTKIIWSKDNADEIDNAKATFDRLTKKGHVAFSVKGKDGQKGEKLHAFDPDAERIIFTPPMVAG